MTTTPASGTTTTRDYVGAFQYLNNNLFEIGHPEGRYSPTGGYEFFHKDHLGNVRAVTSQTTTAAGALTAVLTQYTDYDPWGLPLWGALSGGNSTNRVGFNGKEAVSELGPGMLDFGARLQDSQIGRWGAIDPMAEKYESISPYSYAFNNPIRFLDIKGADPGDVAVLFAGANLAAWREPFGSTNSIERALQAQYFGPRGGSISKFTSDYYTINGGSVSGNSGSPYRVKVTQNLDALTQEAYDYIKDNLQKDGRLLIYGYSWGGVLANYLTKRLQRDGIGVDNLIIIDAANGPKSDEVDRRIPSNVLAATNFFQESESLPVNSRGFPASVLTFYI